MTPRPHGNLLLRSLAPGDLRLLAPHLKRISFGPGERVASPQEQLDQLLFPESLLVTYHEPRIADDRAHVGMVGREGMVGWPLLLGGDRSSFLAIAQLQGGTALSIRKHILLEACRISASLSPALLRYVHNFMMQLACTIVSNASDPIERRVVRWLLMMHDRTPEDVLPLTHDHVSSALNVRRASVTDCFHILEGEGLLRCMRGRIAIRDRAGLQALAGDSYGMVEGHYARDIGPFGRAA
ncbi:Crp/Fnr family transcriptional regulator [Sphingomonas sp. M1-B02]|uniref:Crp/Fnr family transcriptional regulator n=1 Tax=Sphingomonas sp. M1-B02 TaxID=3114300 RepID=UPI00223EA2D9|nr:Crp/Fnr family transcriptional regulator [Sphingomonas sp. S6-11]UZK67678.1 Crp/Fnr family transcriptional regulator [Sphingomonas sp. S6-11]